MSADAPSRFVPEEHRFPCDACGSDLRFDPAAGALTIVLCRNGEEVARQQIADATLLFDEWTAACVIGQGFGGKIAEVRIWDAARTPQAIKDSMYLRLTGREVNDTLHISDVDLPAGTRPTITDRDFVIANIKAPSGLKSQESEDAGEDESGEDDAEE